MRTWVYLITITTMTRAANFGRSIIISWKVRTSISRRLGTKRWISSWCRSFLCSRGRVSRRRLQSSGTRSGRRCPVVTFPDRNRVIETFERLTVHVLTTAPIPKKQSCPLLQRSLVLLPRVESSMRTGCNTHKAAGKELSRANPFRAENFGPGIQARTILPRNRKVAYESMDRCNRFDIASCRPIFLYGTRGICVVQASGNCI